MIKIIWIILLVFVLISCNNKSNEQEYATNNNKKIEQEVITNEEKNINQNIVYIDENIENESVNQENKITEKSSINSETKVFNTMLNIHSNITTTNQNNNENIDNNFKRYLTEYIDNILGISFLYNKNWVLKTDSRIVNWIDVDILTINTDNFKVGKSLPSWEFETNIKIEIFVYKDKKGLEIPYWMFFWEEKTKIIKGINWNNLYINIYINYLNDNTMTDKTPWVKEYRKEVEYYNNIYKVDIEKMLDTISLSN